MADGDGLLPLEGVRIADFSWIAAGPMSTRILGALGAEVIKVTSQRRIDPSTRQRATYVSLNLNKKCCTINLSEPEGAELARRLVAVSDVLVENYGYGAMDRMGLGYSDLTPLRPDLIYVTSSGLGRTGPEKDRVAYGSMLNAYTGWSSVTGYEGGEPLAGHYWTDPVVGMTLAYSIIACLYHREETGRGQYVDLSMAEAATALLPEVLMDYVMNRRVPGPQGNRDPFMAPHGAYRCLGRDRWVAIAVANDDQWHALCQAIGRSDLDRDPTYATLMGRWLHQEALDREIALWTQERTNTEVMQVLQRHGVPAGVSATASDLMDDVHLNQRGFICRVEMDGQPRAASGLPWQPESGVPWRFFPAPEVGEHNDYVFRQLLGLPQDELERLVETRVIY